MSIVPGMVRRDHRLYPSQKGGALIYNRGGSGISGPPLPSAPTDFTVTPTNTVAGPTASADASWTYAVDPSGGFRIEFSLDGSTWSEVTVVLGSERSYPNLSTAFGTDEQYFRIIAIVDGIDSLPSNVFFVPAAPTVTSAIVTDATTIAVTSTGSGVVEWQTTTNGTTWTTNALTSANGNLTVADSSLITGAEVSDSGSWFSVPVQPTGLTCPTATPLASGVVVQPVISGTADRWYKYTATQDGTLTITTANSV